MDEQSIRQNSEASIEFINSRFDHYKRILDSERKTSDDMIESIRRQTCLVNETDEQFRLRTELDRIELVNQLDYLEQEVDKTYEENKTCLFKLFQKLFRLHREFAFDDVLLNEQEIEKIFQYHPCLISNIEKFASTLKSPKENFSFSNRLPMNTYQSTKSNSEYESNEIDLTQYIRDTARQDSNEKKFNFSNLSKYSRQPKQSPYSTNKYPSSNISCDSALLSAANKRFVLLYNMNSVNKLYIFDMENDRTKDFPWNEDMIYSLGHVDSNIFYIITSTKILLFDIIKEILTKEYFLYDSLYKDFLLIFNDNSYRTILKANNQLPSFVFDDYCYYLYTNKDYNQILIKCSLDNFQQETNINLTKTYPQITTFLGLVITHKSLITFLIFQSNTFSLLCCDESRNYVQIKQISIAHAQDASQILSTSYANIRSKSSKQIWLILDRISNCIHCLANEMYVTNIPSTKSMSIQSIGIYGQKLILAYNEFFVDSLDLDELFVSLKL